MLDLLLDLALYGGKFFGVLFSIQLLWQLLISSIKHYYLWKMKRVASPVRDEDYDNGGGDELEERSALGIPFIRFMGQLLGLTGDNSPKKRIIAHDLWKSFTLVFVAHLVALSFSNSILPSWSQDSVVFDILVAVILTILTKLSNIFLLLKTYSEAGFGFNLYLKGFRVIGIDYHAWQIRQDPKTGKPLARDQQYWSRARPHLDIPSLNLHHWPFDQFDDADTLKSLMAEKSAQRAEKEARKESKRQRREEKLRARNTGANASSASSPVTLSSPSSPSTEERREPPTQEAADDDLSPGTLFDS